MVIKDEKYCCHLGQRPTCLFGTADKGQQFKCKDEGTQGKQEVRGNVATRMTLPKGRTAEDMINDPAILAAYKKSIAAEVGRRPYRRTKSPSRRKSVGGCTVRRGL